MSEPSPAVKGAARQTAIAPGEPMTGEQAAEFRERFAAAAADWRPHVLPPPAPMTPDEVRSLLRECVTILEPGQSLALRVTGLTPQQHHEYQRFVDDWHRHGDLPFQVFIFAGDGFGVVDADGTMEKAREVTHRLPPEGEGLMPCCGQTPYEVPRTDRMTQARELVTCTGEARDHP